MKKFTVKDFITCNNPCFACGKKINFQIGYCRVETGELASSGHQLASYLRPIVLANYTEVDLKITYIDAIKLYIFHKDNKILSNNQGGLANYLSNHKLFLVAECTCRTRTESGFLDFHLTTEHQYASAVEIRYECLMVTEKDNIYQFNSSFLDNKSTLIVYKNDGKYPAPC